jgi:toxin ParE1/3/4
MARHVYRTPQVPVDLWEIASHISQDDRTAAVRFLDAAEETFQQLAISPDLGSRGEFDSPHLLGVLRWRVKGFKRYLIFYRPKDDGVEVIRVIHSARDIEALFANDS